jgi:hypothetical protein
MANKSVSPRGKLETELPVRKRPFYLGLSFQVIVAVLIAIVFGVVNPAKAAAMKPLGDVFIRMISMIITLVIFCTVSAGIAGMQDLKKVGRVGGKALLFRNRFDSRTCSRIGCGESGTSREWIQREPRDAGFQER